MAEQKEDPLETLRQYQAWRTGRDEGVQHRDWGLRPRIVTEAIDAIILEVEQARKERRS